MLASDRGSAPVEFLAFGIPGFLCLIGGFQLIWAGYLSNVAYDAAVEGATIASTSDGSIETGNDRAQLVLKSLIGPADYTVEPSDGQLAAQQATVYSVTVTSPVLGFGAIPITQSAEVVNEFQN